MKKLNILLTNDDGIDGEGLKVLAEVISRKHNVFIVAPSENRSGVASSITMLHKLTIRKVKENVFSCSGTPVDCCVAGLRSDLISAKIDCVLSGINKGANLGTDVIYSGTAAAARQASFEGVPGIAISLESYDETWKFETLACYISDNLERFVSMWKPGCFLNINAASLDDYKGEEICSLSCRDYHDKVIIEQNGDTVNQWLSHYDSLQLTSTGDEKNDYAVSRNGKVAVSLVASQPVIFL